MNFTDIFIRRPVLAMVLSLIIILVGLKSYVSLPIWLYPKVDASVVTINVTYAGADAALMEGFVTTPIENAISGIDGVDYISSSSQYGQTVITVYFNLGYDINVAVSDVNSKVSSVRSVLPKEIDDPVVSKQDPNATPMLYMSFDSDSMNAEQVTDYLERVVQPQLQTLNGVASAQILGAREYAMRIWLDPKMMASHGIATSDVNDILYANNYQAPSGPIKSDWQQLNVKTHADLSTSQQFNDMIIKSSGNQLTRISDIGRAELGAKNTDFSLIMDDKNVVGMAIVASPTANPLETANAVKKVMPILQKSMPTGMHSKIVWDNSIYIKQSISEVKKTIIESVICVVAVVFLFLGSFRTLTIPLATIPISLIGVCGIMFAMGYSLNTITFLSFVLAIGMVVDDAIVVSENIHRQIALGHSAFDAAILGAREIQFAVISMTLTLAAVYAPIGFLTGLTGSLFKEFAFTLAAAVIVSGIIALTLSPMMCSRVMTKDVMSGKLAHFSHQEFERIASFYRRALERVLRVRKLVLLMMVIILGASYVLYTIIPSELAPHEDIGGFLTVITGPTSAGLQYTEKYTKEVAKIYRTIPEGADYFIVNGLNGPNTALSFMLLKPWSDRKRTSDDIIGDVFPKMWSITGINAFPVNPSMLPGSTGNMPLNLVVQTQGSYEELNKVMQKLLAAAHANPELTNIDTDLKIDQAQVDVNIDLNKAGDLGIKSQDIGNAVNMVLGEPTLNRFSIMGRSYYVIPQFEEQYRKQPSTLNLLYLHSGTGELIPMSNLVTMHETLQPQSLAHFQQMRSATLSASMKQGYTLGQAVTYLQKAAATIVPQAMQINYSGESRQYMQASGTMEETFAFALIFIFLVLAAQFESFRDPLIVLFSVPLSVFGALLAIKITGSTLNIYSQIGIVTLVGLISKHGILMVEFANQLQEGGKSIHDAIVDAAAIRLRPVLMTTGAMVLGALPLAMAHGAGAVSRRQIGWVIIGGMTIGTIFTLFVVPTMYTYLATRKAKHQAAAPISLEEKNNDVETKAGGSGS